MAEDAAKLEVLSRIAGATRAPVAPAEASYRRAGTGSRAVVIAQFAERVADYRAAVHTLRAPELPAKIAEVCARLGAAHLLIPADLPASWLPSTVAFSRDEGLSYAQLDGGDGVLTGCALAVAETGTLVLDGGPAQGRRALTLLPDLHLCVVFAEQVLETVPEAVTALAGAARAGRPLTLISGPSATSDIELSRVEGVHGPRTLEVLLVTGGRP